MVRTTKTRNNKKKKLIAYRERSEERRAEYQEQISHIPEDRLVFVDECGLHTYLQREYARAIRGVTVEEKIPGRKFDALNVIGALFNKKHIAIECYHHTTDSAFFEQWFAENLLAQIPHGEGYTIIMDNASFHSKKRLRALAEGKVNLLFLPPYSPDYNPIEHSWANMKRFLISNVRNFKSLDAAIYDYFKVAVN